MQTCTTVIVGSWGTELGPRPIAWVPNQEIKIPVGLCYLVLLTNCRCSANETDQPSEPTMFTTLHHSIRATQGRRRSISRSMQELFLEEVLTFKSLSTLATIVADFGDNLSQKTATFAVFCDSRRFRRQCGHWTGLKTSRRVGTYWNAETIDIVPCPDMNLSCCCEHWSYSEWSTVYNLNKPISRIAAQSDSAG